MKILPQFDRMIRKFIEENFQLREKAFIKVTNNNGVFINAIERGKISLLESDVLNGNRPVENFHEISVRGNRGRTRLSLGPY